MYQINIPYTLNLHGVVRQMQLNQRKATCTQSSSPVPTSAVVLIVLFPSQISSFVLPLPSALLLDLVFSFPSPSAVLAYSEGQDPCKKMN